jgi:hypothetical protein
MTPIPVIQGSALTNTLATYYTVPSGDNRLKSVQLTSMRLVNTDTVTRTVTLHIVPSGASATVANTRLKTFAVESATLGDPPAYFAIDDVMLPGTTIQANADVGAVVALSVNGMVFP